MEKLTVEQREVILEQIARNVWDGRNEDFSLKYSPDAIRGDKEIVLAFVKHDHSGMRHITENLQNDKEVILAGLQSLNNDTYDPTCNKWNLDIFFKCWASEDIQTLCEGFPGGPIPALEIAVALEQNGENIPAQVSLRTYLDAKSLSDDLKQNLQMNPQRHPTKRVKI